MNTGHLRVHFINFYAFIALDPNHMENGPLSFSTVKSDFVFTVNSFHCCQLSLKLWLSSSCGNQVLHQIWLSLKHYSYNVLFSGICYVVYSALEDLWRVQTWTSGRLTLSAKSNLWIWLPWNYLSTDQIVFFVFACIYPLKTYCHYYKWNSQHFKKHPVRTFNSCLSQPIEQLKWM